MNKLLSLIKASMTSDMDLFKINIKKQTKFSKILPIIIVLILMSTIFSYAELIIKNLTSIHMEYVLLTLFIFITSIMTFIEGVYKTSSLLFNLKDDNLLLSLPIKRSIVLFIRIFKFYVFELLYNSIFLIPALIVYIKYINPNFIFYIVSIIGIFLFPVIPILLSCLFGSIITYLSSKFKGKNIAQTIFTMIFIIIILYFSYNSENLISGISKNAININDFITKFYYPAGAYINLLNNFNVFNLILFVFIHILIFILVIMFIGKTYFKINSNIKSIKTSKNNKKYLIKRSSITKSLIKKEFNRIINSTVFITNTAFGLVLFLIGCVLLSMKFGDIINSFNDNLIINIPDINNIIPLLLFSFVCLTSFMTSMTSSMISLEGRSFNILKSLPVKPYNIINSKVLASLLLIVPCLLLGDLIIFIRFKFDLLSIILILLASVIFPLISQTIGIIVNLKYPKLDAKNDTEVVKQSMSSMISVFLGMLLGGVSVYFIINAMLKNIPSYLIMFIAIIMYIIIYLLLLLYLSKNCDKQFNNISI